MIRGILVLLALTFITNAEAQTGFEADPMLVDTSFDATTPDPVAKGKICNTGADSICLLWRIEEDMVPIDWQAYFCDKNLCYGPGTFLCPDDVPVCLAPGECGNMDLHLIPGASPVCGKFRVVVWEKGDTSNSLVINYQFNCATSTKDAIDVANLNVFPNPTSDYFEITNNENIKSLSIHNLLGKHINTYSARVNSRFDVSQLPNGMYVVNLFDDRNTVVKSVRLKKK